MPRSTASDQIKKRDLSKTAKPLFKNGHQPIFVIQEHHASHLHYDFRIEIDGVLASWAVPKGPSNKPHIKRLAIFTEDHPLKYASFQGTISSGYGAGTVTIWDTGHFDNLSDDHGKPITLAQAYTKGHIKLFLHGRKLEGNYALIRFNNNDKNWLLIKLD